MKAQSADGWREGGEGEERKGTEEGKENPQKLQMLFHVLSLLRRNGRENNATQLLSLLWYQEARTLKSQHGMVLMKGATTCVIKIKIRAAFLL